MTLDAAAKQPRRAEKRSPLMYARNSAGSLTPGRRSRDSGACCRYRPHLTGSPPPLLAPFITFPWLDDLVVAVVFFGGGGTLIFTRYPEPGISRARCTRPYREINSFFSSRLLSIILSYRTRWILRGSAWLPPSAFLFFFFLPRNRFLIIRWNLRPKFGSARTSELGCCF